MEQVNTRRLVDTFAALVAVDSPSFGERAMADVLRDRLAALGIACTEDNAGKTLGGSAGNLFARVPGTLDRPAVLLCMHMDTVEPAKGKRAVQHEDGRITSTGDTVLGADDLTGVAAILEVLETLQERKIPHRPIELLFTVAEEPYCAGVRHFDFTQCTAKTGYVLDLTGAVGTAAIAAPTILSFTVEIEGRAAHAGFAPETGVHAIAVAAAGLAQLTQGRLEPGTTLNVGRIAGGTAANIVPERCTLSGEIRSMRHERAVELYETLCALFRTEAERVGASVQTTCDIPLHAYRASEDGEAAQRFIRACVATGLSAQFVETFGGSDNAALQQHGIDGLVVANAMFQCHSTHEYTTADDLRKTAELLYALLVDEI